VALKTITLSDWAWLINATNTTSTTASSRRNALDAGAGANPLRTPGSGCEPRTLSTTIFRGSGVRRATGVARRLRRKIPVM